jgi:glycosyltransferase involved in cell wall biosynthesis
MKIFYGKIKRFFFKQFRMAGVNRRYIKTPALKTALVSMKSSFLLITPIDLELLEMQYQSLRNIEDQFDYLVVDTSKTDDMAAVVESFCAKNNISYMRQPKNPGLDASLKHGFSLNWAFYNAVEKIKPERFGFLESDVFFVSPGSVLRPWEGKPFWGIKAPSYEKGYALWRLWPGFCFFSRDFYEGKKLNFLPIKQLDTAGGNFEILKNYDTSHLIPWEEVREESCTGDESGSYQAVRNIIHLVGVLSKNDDPIWREGVKKKRELVEKMISTERP